MEPGEDRDSLYAGIGGMAPVLAEIAQYRAVSDAEQVLATGIVARLSAMAQTRTEPSLYTGLGGDVTALKLLAPGSERGALRRLAELMACAGWNTTPDVKPGSIAPVTDLAQGTAGVVLAGIWAGGEHAREIATTGGESMLRAAEQTEDGLDWGMRPGAPSRMPNYSHGTAGIATALAVAGAALTPGATDRRERPTCSRRWRTPVWTRSPGSRPRGCGNGACARSLPPASHGGFARVSGTTTAAVAAPRGWETSCSTPRRTARTRRAPTRYCRRRAQWETPSSSAPSATGPAPGGGSWSIAGIRSCFHPVPHGCKAPRGSPPSSSAWPESSRTNEAPRSSTVPTSGGPSRPSCVPPTPVQDRPARRGRVHF